MSALRHLLTFEEAHIAAIALKTTMPNMSRYIHASDLEGKTAEGIADSLREMITKSVRRYTWNLVGWIILTIAIGTIVIILTTGTAVGKNRKQPSSTPNSWEQNIDF